MENYIVINGKKAELTKEQLEKLGIEVKKESPFERKREGCYCFISTGGVVDTSFDNSLLDQNRYNVANYCYDKDLMEQRALHETLDRLLWRFACENGELEHPWDCKHPHWYIICDISDKKFSLANLNFAKCDRVYFPSKEIAQRAIDEIVKPFMKEHPDFVW